MSGHISYNKENLKLGDFICKYEWSLGKDSFSYNEV